MEQRSQRTDEAGLVVIPTLLSGDAFRPFGEVIEHVGIGRRHVIASAFDGDGMAPDRRLWVSRIEEPGRLPLRVTRMERHPHSAQLFSPLACGEYLVAACPTREDGAPDIDALSAFIARTGQGVVYRRNVWHHPMVVLGSPALFTVSMAVGCADDDVFVTIDRHVTIAAAAGHAS